MPPTPRRRRPSSARPPSLRMATEENVRRRACALRARASATSDGLTGAGVARRTDGRRRRRRRRRLSGWTCQRRTRARRAVRTDGRTDGRKESQTCSALPLPHLLSLPENRRPLPPSPALAAAFLLSSPESVWPRCRRREEARASPRPPPPPTASSSPPTAPRRRVSTRSAELPFPQRSTSCKISWTSHHDARDRQE